jgi:hypothetical protein
MRFLAKFKRSTAPATGKDAKRSAAIALSSPAAAQRGVRGAGLDNGAPAVALSAIPSIALLCSPTNGRQLSTKAAALGRSASTSSLYQLDGRDLVRTFGRRIVVTN